MNAGEIPMRAQEIKVGKEIIGGWVRLAISRAGVACVGVAFATVLSSPLSSAAAGDQTILADTFSQMMAASASKVAPVVKEYGYSVGGPGSTAGGSSVLTDTYNAAFAASVGPGALPMPPVPAALVLHFDNGSARVTVEERRKIAALASEHGAEGGYFRVVGHASSRTRDLPLDKHVQVNFDVSLERANSVASALMRAGVTPDNMSVEARSDSEPLYYESMPASEAGNRRVEIFVQ